MLTIQVISQQLGKSYKLRLFNYMTQIILFTKPILAGFLSLIAESFLVTTRAERCPLD